MEPVCESQPGRITGDEVGCRHRLVFAANHYPFFKSKIIPSTLVSLAVSNHGQCLHAMLGYA